MEILVVGGAGYIGSHMVKMLGSHGHTTVTFDNLSSGQKDKVTSGEIIVGDLADSDALDRLFYENKFDAVMHFASSIEVNESIQNPLKYYENNVSCSGIGCANWDTDNTESYTGSSSAQSGIIGNSQSTDISVTLDVTANGEIDFYYRVSAEYSSSGNYFYDGLEFYIDDVLKGQYQSTTGGGSPWTNVTYDVSEGEHTFRWSYVKDGGGGSTDCDNTNCADAAWVDDITFPPAYMESDGMPGDMNMDGIINILDVIVIINMILGVEGESALADLNGDGSINIQDIILVINLILT